MRRLLVGAVIGALAMSSTAHARGGEPYDVGDGKPIGRSSILNGPNGVYVSPVDGNVYAASVIGSEITVHDPRTGALLDRIGAERGVNGPDDLVIAPDGTIYWTELIAGNVGMLRPDGTWRTQLVAPGVNPITLSDDGRLFVARDFLGDGLYELDPELLAPPQVIIPDLVGFNGMDFGPDGLLYGPLFFGGAIVRIDVDAAVPAPEIVATGFRIPGAVAFSPDGVLHAVDFAEGQVVRVDVDTGATEVLADVEGVLDNLAFGADGTLFTTAFADGQVLTLTPGNQLRALNQSGFIAPGGVTVDDDGSVWVADFFSIREMRSSRNPATSFYDRFDPPGAGAASANTIDASGDHLITTGWFSNSVQVLDRADGSTVEDIRTLALPINAIDHGGVLAVAQLGAGNVVDGRTGDVLLDGVLAYPLGLASDGSTLYVGDWALGQVWAVHPGGPPTLLASGLVNPEGMTVDGDRLLVVEEGADRVSAVDLATGAVSDVITGLALGDPVVPGAVPHGIVSSVDASDRSIYVTSDIDNTVRQFKR
jgi:sugar lactone lactonase YvrE